MDEQDDAKTAAVGPEPEDEVPAWLQELGATLTEEDQSADTDSLDDGSEIPDWLQDLRASLPEDSEAETDRTEKEEGTPDWLTELRSTAAQEEPESTPPAPELEVPAMAPEEEGMADWLAELRSDAEEAEPESQVPAMTPEVPAMAPEPEETPDWLARLSPAAEEAEPEVPEIPATAPEAEEMPDWLTGLEPTVADAESEPEPSDLQAEGEELPDWLAKPETSSGETEPGPEPPDQELEEVELPDWLAALQPAAIEKEPEVPAMAPESGPPDLKDGVEETPDRLDEPSAAEEEFEPASFALEAEEEELPGWLAELQTRDETTELEPVPPALELEAEQLTDPLTDLQAEDAEGAVVEALPSTTVPEIEQGEIPDWLAEFQPSVLEEEPETKAPGAKEVAVAAAAAAATPDWPAGVQEEDAETPLAVEEMPGEVADLEAEPEPADLDLEPEAELLVPASEAEGPPDPLSESQPPDADEEPKAESPGVKEIAVAAAAAAAVPDWLAAIEIEVEEDTPQAVDETDVDVETPAWSLPPEPGWEAEDRLTPAEIPAWLLALKPTELREEGEAEIPADAFEEPEDDTGLLAGLKGILPVEMLIAQPRAMTEAPAADALLSDTPQARMFADIVGRPPEAAPKEIAPEPTRILAQVPRWIIFLVLIVAVTIPLVLGKPLLPHSIESTPAEEDLYTAIEALDSNAPVLLAFDYDPATSGEMNVVSQTLVGHLMDRRARVVSMSLLPAGPATAQLLLDKVAAGRTDYADSYGRLYANLGYLPGQAAAVRLAALSLEAALPHDYYGTPLSDLPVMQGLTSTQSFDLIVELAATQDSLRWWVEQAGTPYDIPLGAGASASVAPLARPYYETEQRQLVGMVSGVPGAVSYEALRSGQAGPPDAVAARLDSLMAGYAILILVLLIGNVAYLARRGAGRGR